MKILFICDEYPPGKHGGIGTMVQILGHELVKQGHSVFVVGLYAYSYGEKAYEEDKGVKVWRLRYGINLHLPTHHVAHKIFNKIPDVLKQHLNGKKAFEKFIYFINELIDKEEIDVIEIQDWNTFAMRIGFIVSYPKFSIPLIVKSNGSYSYFCHETNETPKKKLAQIDRELYNRADALAAVSIYTANINKQLFNSKKEITILYNGIEIPHVSSLNKRADKKIIFTGTLVAKKGIFQLIKAWNIVTKKHPDAQLLIYGKGDTNVIKQLLKPHAQDTVVFAGHVSRQILFEELATATMAIFPSYSEAFALAPLEAMAVGCPIINTLRASGSELITDKYNGSLINPDDIDNIAEKTIQLIENKSLQKQYSEYGKKTALEKFNIVKSAQEHTAYYTHIIKTIR